jgi:hypothetical protein
MILERNVQGMLKNSIFHNDILEPFCKIDFESMFVTVELLYGTQGKRMIEHQ